MLGRIVFASVLGSSLFLPRTLHAQSDVAFPPEVYAQRRTRLAERVGGAPVIVPGEYLIGSGGVGKQDPNFWYLTGVESPYAILVTAPGSDGRREVLFLPEEFQFAGAQYPLDDARFRRAAWNRPIRRLSPGAAAVKATGIPETHPLDELTERLPQVVGGAETVYFARDSRRLYAPPGLTPPRSIRQQLEQAISERLPGKRLKNVTPIVEHMRLIKDQYEIAALRRAAEISVKSFHEVMAAVRPGMNDLEVAGLMEYVWKREGSPRASFDPIVSSGEAAVSLYTLKSENYNPVDRVMQGGELLFIDYGAAEYDMYASDVCRTYPVSGRFTAEQRKYYEIVLEAQEAALARIKPGVMMLDVVKAAAEVFRKHGLERFEDIGRMGEGRVWGLMPSPTHYLGRGAGISRSYSGVRGTGVRDLGHHIGLDTIDGRDSSLPLAPGMVFTVEPKMYIPEKSLAIMIEDMILVTEGGYENLSADAPRSVEGIEKAMAAKR
ncbi:MAG: aminopeptidase P N-terminal domain-containing protein [Acidobacteriota bacterium]